MKTSKSIFPTFVTTSIITENLKIFSQKIVRFDLFLYFRPTEETGVYSLDNIGLVQNAEMGQWEGMSQRKKWVNGNEQ